MLESKQYAVTLELDADSTPMRSELNTAHLLTNLTRAKAELKFYKKMGF